VGFDYGQSKGEVLYEKGLLQNGTKLKRISSDEISDHAKDNK